MDYGFIIRSIILQLIIFSLIPFLYWIVVKRKEMSFFTYVGLYRPQKNSTANEVIIFTIIYLVVYGIVHFTPISNLTQPSANSYAGLGFVAIIPAFFVSFIQQALAEEILFRGFIGKNSINKFGFKWGNFIQAMIFGAIHVLFSLSDNRDIISYSIIMVSITAGGWLLGYLDEKLFKGSIIPSVLLHGFGNFIMVMSVAF